jgi:hypothetical protein
VSTGSHLSSEQSKVHFLKGWAYGAKQIWDVHPIRILTQFIRIKYIILKKIAGILDLIEKGIIRSLMVSKFFI